MLLAMLTAVLMLSACESRGGKKEEEQQPPVVRQEEQHDTVPSSETAQSGKAQSLNALLTEWNGKLRCGNRTLRACHDSTDPSKTIRVPRSGDGQAGGIPGPLISYTRLGRSPTGKYVLAEETTVRESMPVYNYVLLDKAGKRIKPLCMESPVWLKERRVMDWATGELTTLEPAVHSLPLTRGRVLQSADDGWRIVGADGGVRPLEATDPEQCDDPNIWRHSVPVSEDGVALLRGGGAADLLHVPTGSIKPVRESLPRPLPWSGKVAYSTMERDR